MSSISKILFISTFFMSSTCFINNIHLKNGIIQKYNFNYCNTPLHLKKSNYNLNNTSLKNSTIYKMNFNYDEKYKDNNFLFLKLYFYTVSTIYLFQFILNYIK
jgi:hypothetical protein